MVKKRIGWIDVVRCFAMMLIIIGHTYATGFIQYLIFAVNVPIFFVLSGYLTKIKPIKKVALSGIKTLLIPYLVTVCVMLLISLINTIHYVYFLSKVSMKFLVAAGIYGIGTPSTLTIFRGHNVPAIGAIWFLLAMYFGNIVYQLVLRIIYKKNDKWYEIIAVIFSVVLAFIGIELSKFIILPWSINATLISIVFYLAGHLIKTYNLTELNFKNTVLSIVGLILWIYSAVKGPFWFNIGYAAHPVIDVLGAIGGSYFLILFIKYFDRKNWMKFGAYFGRISLVMLSVHIIHIYMFNDVPIIINYLSQNGVNRLIIGLITDAYRLVVCFAISFLLSRIKLIKQLFAIR